MIRDATIDKLRPAELQAALGQAVPQYGGDFFVHHATRERGK
jgi:hypothetical protein